MDLSDVGSPSGRRERLGAADAETADPAWKSLYRVAGIAALITLVLIPVQEVVFIAWPPPSAAIDYFTLLQSNKLLGLLSLDLLYVIDNALLIPIFLALYVALRRDSESFTAAVETRRLERPSETDTDKGESPVWWQDLLWGFWNGLTAWIVLIVHVFGGWKEYPFYDLARAGNWYDFGFLLGAGSPILGALGGRGRGGSK